MRFRSGWPRADFSHPGRARQDRHGAHGPAPGRARRSSQLEGPGSLRRHADTPDPPAGQIVKDPRTGEPTGILRNAYSVLKDLPSDAYGDDGTPDAGRTETLFSNARSGCTSRSETEAASSRESLRCDPGRSRSAHLPRRPACRHPRNLDHGCWPDRLPCPLRSRRVVEQHPTEAN